MVTGMAGAMLVATGGMLEEPATAGVGEGMEEEANGMLVVPGVPETVVVVASGLEARTLVGTVVGNAGAVIIVGATKPLLAEATALAKSKPDV